MSGARHSLTRSRSNPVARGIAAESCHSVPGPDPPECVANIPQYHDSSAGPSEQSQACHDAADSDSGDSLFLTQKPVPKAVRSTRRRHPSNKPNRTHIVDLDDHEKDDKRSPAKRWQITPQLPKYSFSFLTGRKWKPGNTTLPSSQNKSLHNYMMGGFFKCVRDLWQGNQTADDLLSSLPTVDMDWEDISPLTEPEGEAPSDEDVKVVERKRLVVLSKTKNPQPWHVAQRREKLGKRREEREAERKISKRRQIPAEASISQVAQVSSGRESTDDEDSSGMVQRGRNDDNVTSDFNAQREMPKTKRCITRGTQTTFFPEKAAELCDDHDAASSTIFELNELRDTAVNRPQLDRAPSDVCHTGEPAARDDSHLISDSNGHAAGSETTATERRKERVDQEDGAELLPSQEKGGHAVTSENVAVAEVEEIPNVCDDATASPEAQASDKLEISWRHDEDMPGQDSITEGDVPTLKLKKKKRKKSELTDITVGQEEEDGGCNVVSETSRKKKKKKKKKISGEKEDEDEQLSFGAETKPQNGVCGKKRKKEKRFLNTEEHKEEEEASNPYLDPPQMSAVCLNDTTASPETINHVERKKHGKNICDATPVGGEDDATPTGSIGEMKKKKKKKKRSREKEDENEQLSFGAVTEPQNDVGEKKRKKEKGFLNTEEHKEEEESSEAYSGPPQMPAVCINDTTASPETINHVERKKHGKSICDATPAGSTGEMKKKKNKALFISDGVDLSSRFDKELADQVQKTREENDVEVVTKKKKKKNGTLSKYVSEASAAQSDDEVSVREKTRTSSFLVADADENVAGAQGKASQPEEAHAEKFETESAEIHVEESSKRKKMRRKAPAEFDEPEVTGPYVSPETTEKRVKRKKKRRRDGSQSVVPMEEWESAAATGHLQTDDKMLLTKKKRKENPPHVTQENPETTAEPSSERPEGQAFTDQREEKTKLKMKYTDDVSLGDQLMTWSAESKAEKKRKKRKKESNVPPADPSSIPGSPIMPAMGPQSETASSQNTNKNTLKNGKKKLLNPTTVFLTSC